MKVCVIIASNSSDFSEAEVVVAGTDRTAADKELIRVLTEKWNKCDESDLEFYETLDKYIASWYSSPYDLVLA